MSKRKKNRGKPGAVTARKHGPGSGNVTTPGTLRVGSTGLLRPAYGAAHDPSRKWRWLGFGMLALCLAVGGWLYWAHEEGEWPFQTVIKGKLLKEEPHDFPSALRKAAKQPPQEKWKIDAWRPASEQDNVIDRFVTLHRANDRAAGAMLTALPDATGILSEEEYERGAAGDFLRKSDVRITDVWRGEPDANGKPRPAAKRYVLVTKGDATTPSLRVRDRAGNVSPTSFGLHDPIIVVEVQGKKILPLRTEINKRP